MLTVTRAYEFEEAFKSTNSQTLYTVYRVSFKLHTGTALCMWGNPKLDRPAVPSYGCQTDFTIALEWRGLVNGQLCPNFPKPSKISVYCGCNQSAWYCITNVTTALQSPAVWYLITTFSLEDPAQPKHLLGCETQAVESALCLRHQVLLHERNRMCTEDINNHDSEDCRL